MIMIKSIFVLASLIFTLSVSAGEKAALGGYCPVAYVKMGEAVKGDEKFSSTIDGKKYLFVHADAKKMFDKSPKQFTNPLQYDGFCATAIGAMNKKLESDPTIFSTVGKKIYFFSNQEAKEMFDKDPKSFIEKADKNWKTLK